MLGSETASLFSRGPQSVRLVRFGRAGGPARLFVLGPGTATSTYESPDTIDCVNYQLQIESALVGEGYQLASFTSADRRSGGDRRGNARGGDRRRQLQLVASADAVGA